MVDRSWALGVIDVFKEYGFGGGEYLSVKDITGDSTQPALAFCTMGAHLNNKGAEWDVYPSVLQNGLWYSEISGQKEYNDTLEGMAKPDRLIFGVFERFGVREDFRDLANWLVENGFYNYSGFRDGDSHVFSVISHFNDRNTETEVIAALRAYARTEV